MNLRDELADMLRLKSCRYSDRPEFKLASGKMSRYYIDCRQTTYSARGNVSGRPRDFPARKG